MPPGGGPNLPDGESCPCLLRSATCSARSSRALARSGQGGPETRLHSDAWWLLVDIAAGNSAAIASRGAVRQVPALSSEPQIVARSWDWRKRTVAGSYGLPDTG